MSPIFKRNCVTCPSTAPPCVKCPSGKVCSISYQTCESCPQAKCVSQSSVIKKSTGAIAGGVVGGLVGVGIILGILLWYKFRGRRNRHLQEMKEAALTYDNPDDLQYPEEDDEDDEEAEEEEFKRKSGISNQSSNAIPIMSPQRNQSSITTSRRLGPPTIRDSIHDSEYSVESEYIPGANNQALRAYDVAVQGLPNLIHVSKPVRPPSGRHMLGRINEGETQSQRSQSFRSMRTQNTELPQVPVSRQSSLRKTLNPPESLNGDDRVRFSKASSDYVADLPEEAKLYKGLY